MKNFFNFLCIFIVEAITYIGMAISLILVIMAPVISMNTPKQYATGVVIAHSGQAGCTVKCGDDIFQISHQRVPVGMTVDICYKNLGWATIIGSRP